MTKRRITVTVDGDLVVAASNAVNAGDASSVSAWVNEAMAAKSEKRRLLAALAEAIEDYEAEFGEITDEEIEERRRLDREAAEQVRARMRERKARGEFGT